MLSAKRSTLASVVACICVCFLLVATPIPAHAQDRVSPPAGNNQPHGPGKPDNPLVDAAVKDLVNGIREITREGGVGLKKGASDIVADAGAEFRASVPSVNGWACAATGILCFLAGSVLTLAIVVGCYFGTKAVRNIVSPAV